MLKVLSKKMEVKVSVILIVSGYSPVITDSLIGLRNIPVRASVVFNIKQNTVIYTGAPIASN